MTAFVLVINSNTLTPPINGNTKNAAVDSTTCKVPMPNANFDSPFNLSTVNSNPCSNNKNNTPKSAIDSISCKSANKPSPAGPITNPALRKPITALAFNHLNNGTIPIVAQRKINKSFPKSLNFPGDSK